MTIPEEPLPEFDSKPNFGFSRRLLLRLLPAKKRNHREDQNVEMVVLSDPRPPHPHHHYQQQQQQEEETEEGVEFLEGVTFFSNHVDGSDLLLTAQRKSSTNPIYSAIQRGLRLTVKFVKKQVGVVGRQSLSSNAVVFTNDDDMRQEIVEDQPRLGQRQRRKTKKQKYSGYAGLVGFNAE